LSQNSGLLPKNCALRSPLPYLQFEAAILVNQLEAGAVGGNQLCAMGAGGQRNQQIKVQIAQYGRL
jgi:hypothetical protein